MDMKCKLPFMYAFLSLMLIYTWTSARIPSSIKYDTFIKPVFFDPRPKKPLKMKYILQWTSPDWYPFSEWGRGRKEFFRLKCKISNCYVTSNRYLLRSITDFDAIAFHAPEMYHTPGPSRRSVHQKYVFTSLESAHNYPLCLDRYDNYFNWTLTFRLDSNIIYRYITVTNSTGHVIGPQEDMHWMDAESMEPISDETKELLSTKNKLAAWLVSNCNACSNRSHYVKVLNDELEEYGLWIDIFGGCGDKECPRNQMEACSKMIQREYFFYLSFENSFAEDYVTEKLLWALQNYAIPVVFGAANYSRFMPDGIYLDATKMSPEALAKEMHDIANDKERFYGYFKWRNHYSYYGHDESPDTDERCKLCEMLHNEKLMKKKSVYRHFRRWWNDYKEC